MSRLSVIASCAGAMLALVATLSYAADVKPVFDAGFDFGGDTLISVPTTGSGGGTKTLKAGEGVYLGGGASILLDRKDVEIEVTLSYKFSSISAQNGDIDWSVMPLDALVFYRMPRFRVGGGLTYQIGPTLKGSGVADGLRAKYDDALGVVVEGDYLLGQKLRFGVRLTSVSYKASSIQTSPTLVTNSQPPNKPSATSIGAVFSFRF